MIVCVGTNYTQRYRCTSQVYGTIGWPSLRLKARGLCHSLNNQKGQVQIKVIEDQQVA
jgi:hypothetical protein